MSTDKTAQAATESIDASLHDLDLRSTAEILSTLLASQKSAVNALDLCATELEASVVAAAARLSAERGDSGRLVLVGAGASGRLAVQDGAEMWPTYGWPHERLLLCMAGGQHALMHSVEGVEDDARAAGQQVHDSGINDHDVVVALAASGRSPWTVAWVTAARKKGALTIAAANNVDTPLLAAAEHAVLLDSGAEVLAGSTRMAAGTAQKVFLNLFSTTLMIRLNRTYGNLMVDMAAANNKLDQRRIRMLIAVLPDTTEQQARAALTEAGGWVKLAALVVKGLSAAEGRRVLAQHAGSLRASLGSDQDKPLKDK